MLKQNILLISSSIIISLILISCTTYRFDQIRDHEAKKDDLFLIEALTKSKDSYIRTQAAQSLGRIKSKRATKILITKLSDKDWTVRYYSAWALGIIKDSIAIKPLEIHLKTEEEIYVIQKIKYALKELK